MAGVNERNIKTLAAEAKVQRQTLVENAKAIRLLQDQVTQLRTELSNVSQDLNILKYSKGIGRTA